MIYGNLGQLSYLTNAQIQGVGINQQQFNNPNNGLPALQLDLTYLGTPVSLWFDQISSIPAPGAQQLSISGFIEDVPEPGTMALMIGSGVAGSLLLIRRRRA